MLAKRIIPCLDVDKGRVVKGIKFVSLRDAGDPVEAAKAYNDAGADELVFLDITASHEQRPIILNVVERTAAAAFMPLTVGGGIRTVEDIRALLNAGADKVSINTSAVERPDFINEASGRFGNQCIVVAIDAKRVHNSSTSSGLASEAETALALSKALGIPFVAYGAWGLLHPRKGEGLEQIVPYRFAKEHLVLPLGRSSSKSVTVAFVNPLDLITIEKLSKMFKADIRPVVATKSDLEQAVDQFYGRESAGEQSQVLRWEIYTHGGRTPTGKDAVAWAKEAEQRGAGEILLTSMDRDGTKQGYDVELTSVIASAVRIPVIASGGAGTPDHFYEVLTTGGADAALAASLFHFGEVSIAAVKQFLAARGVTVRS